MKLPMKFATKFVSNSFLILGLLVLGGCSVFSSFNEVSALNEAQAVGSPFTQALADDYRDFANTELKDKFDYPDALHFARKGLSAASGAVVLPEAIDDWNLDGEHERELGAARGRLIVLFDMGARETEPSLSSLAQVKFDCWIEQQEETWGLDSDIGCKNEFYDALEQLETGMNVVEEEEPVVYDEPLAFDVDPAQPMAAENAVYLVFFDWDQFTLTSGANSVLDSVAEEIFNNPPRVLNIVGHTDTSGSKIYNQRLALKRAQTVRDALINRGVAADLIATDARGETELLVDTPDNVREPANRRVNISFN